MNSSMSGCDTSRLTIFAARRLRPPDLIVPAEASAPRMNDTGPDAALFVPESVSWLDRMLDRFTPAPEPPLKISPSSRYQLRIDSSESCTDSRKHAEGVCGTPGTPTLNQTGLLNANFWETIRFARSSANSSACFSESKYP